VIGAGVAGLCALGVAKNLGAVVRAFDSREVVKE
jgi:NAD/NADP transhydrogenase alpha subunit